jgi:hypothetical protein
MAWPRDNALANSSKQATATACYQLAAVKQVHHVFSSSCHPHSSSRKEQCPPPTFMSSSSVTTGLRMTVLTGSSSKLNLLTGSCTYRLTHHTGY